MKKFEVNGHEPSYEIPEEMIEDKGDGVYVIKELPIKDTPLILTFGSFMI